MGLWSVGGHLVSDASPSSKMPCSIRAAKISVGILGTLGVVLLLVGIIALSLFPSITKKKVRENIVLAEGKEAYDKWKKAPIPVMFTVYLFNVTNPTEVEQYGRKPAVKEVGPFVFKQFRSKTIRDWDPHEFTVTYDDMKRYYFMPDISEDPEKKIYSLNMPLMGIAQFAKTAAPFLQRVLVPLFANLFDGYEEHMFVYRTPRELMFEGYKVDILEDVINVLKPFAKVPEILPDNKFAYLYGKNNSGEGEFTVYTGADDIAKYTKITTWNKLRDLDYWDDQYCDMINGTDGAQFPPPITKHDTLYIYTSEICRSLYINFRENSEVRGIPTLRFAGSETLFANAKDNPDNQCYCLPSKRCDYYGLQDISVCKKGMPLVVGAPHFFMAHEAYGELVDGLNPSKERHDSFVDIEPTTGIVMRAARKLQINFAMEKDPTFKQTSNLPTAALPLLWITEEAEMDAELAEAFHAKVRTPVTTAKSVLTACIVLGLLWIATAGCITVGIVLKKQKHMSVKSQYKSVPQKPEENGKKEPVSVNT